MTLIHALSLKAISMEHNDPAEWVRRSQAGDRDAFDRLIDLYYERSFRIAYRILGNREAAEDATQDVFIKAWRHLSRFKRQSNFATWLHSIAVHHALDVSRRQKLHLTRERTLNDDSPPPTAARSAVKGAAQSRPSTEWDRRLAIQEAMGRLPEKQRTVVSLYFFGDYTVQEIADALDLPPATAYQCLRSGIARLERSLCGMEIER